MDKGHPEGRDQAVCLRGQPERFFLYPRSQMRGDLPGEGGEGHLGEKGIRKGYGDESLFRR